MATAVYPNSVLSWTPRIDQVNIIYANDPNSLALEVQAIEATTGTTPQIESSPPAGSNVNYATLSSRVSAANNNALSPYCSVVNTPGFFCNQGAQNFNHYSAQVLDPYGIWNGTDLTIPCNGWWTIRTDQKWNQHGNNFGGCNHHFLYCNGGWIDHDLWNWDAIADSGSYWPANIISTYGWTKIRWEGLLHKGDHIQVLSANSTNCPGLQITNLTLKAFCHRTISTSFVSG
jgi:hypothetical protein